MKPCIFDPSSFLGEQNEMLFCSIPFANARTSNNSMTLARIFQVLNRKKEEKLIETYSLTQTTLEQIFVQLAGEDEESAKDRERRGEEQRVSVPQIDPKYQPSAPSPPIIKSQW